MLHCKTRIRIEDDKMRYLADDQIDWKGYEEKALALEQAKMELENEIGKLPEGLQAGARADTVMVEHMAIGWLILEARKAGVRITGYSPYQDFFASYLQQAEQEAWNRGAKESLLSMSEAMLRAAYGADSNGDRAWDELG